MNNKSIYFPGLNGLRAIAAISVVVAHITLNLKDFNLDPYIFGSFTDGKPRGFTLGGYGVSIFFVLSGFLITYLLQKEKATGTIAVKKFYIRRILRIWPLYYAYLFLAVIVILLAGFSIDTKTLLLYLFFGANIPFILNSGMLFIGHYWSLAVEEQFYLFWPWINKMIKHIITITISLIIIMISVKIILHFFYPGTLLETVIHVTRFHCMLIGALGALFLSNNDKTFMQCANNKPVQIICWLILFLVAINKYHIASVIDNEILSVVTILIIIGQIKETHRIINLELRVFNFLGKISYGIYVLHPLLIYIFSHLLQDIQLPRIFHYFLVYFLIMAATILAAWFSYTYFEKYFLNLKKKFTIIKSKSSIND